MVEISLSNTWYAVPVSSCMLTYLPVPSIVLILVSDSQTSIVFSLEEGPGILFKALAVFALRQINLTKVSCLLKISCFVFYGN